MKVMKVFLSHKMSGLSPMYVNAIRFQAKLTLEYVYEQKGIKLEFIDNYNHDDAPPNAGRLWHLGRSIQQLQDADAMFFCGEWWKAKGCWVERFIALVYKIKILKIK